MTRTIFLTACLLSCGFYLYVLAQWLREGALPQRRPRRPHPGKSDQK